mgnify:CR=1 FL=1
MVGKTLTSRVILLIIAIVLFIAFWKTKMSEGMAASAMLIVIRVIFLLAMVIGNKNNSNDNDK